MENLDTHRFWRESSLKKRSFQKARTVIRQENHTHKSKENCLRFIIRFHPPINILIQRSLKPRPDSTINNKRRNQKAFTWVRSIEEFLIREVSFPQLIKTSNWINFNPSSKCPSKKKFNYSRQFGLSFIISSIHQIIYQLSMRGFHLKRLLRREIMES